MRDVGLSKRLSQYAVQAMLYEVTATPKPGLVDRGNSGAHRDMDIFTFMGSSASLAHYFFQCSHQTQSYLDSTGPGEADCRELFGILRGLGLEAERSMFDATNGVNTHKGLIFSLGIIVSAAAYSLCRSGCPDPDIHDICSVVCALTEGICDKDFKGVEGKAFHTAGEKLYLQHGIKGIRGEAEKGYPIVRDVSYPVMKELMERSGHPINDIFVQVLFHIMAVLEDTNVLNRHDMGVLEEVQAAAQEVLGLGGVFTEAGRESILELDRLFIERNISPGGAADLLAVTIFFHLLDVQTAREEV
ncbi:triphosphoribosyl-dephospho-CoA synthase CitG [Anaerotalea alkaliphila]|nr:triphosphoribosyl-dephospho-CoA synthase CitG [Anaerotalea alkaliphila]